MTEIMPFPENNILFYWTAPSGASIYAFTFPETQSERP